MRLDTVDGDSATACIGRITSGTDSYAGMEPVREAEEGRRVECSSIPQLSGASDVTVGVLPSYKFYADTR